MMESLETRRLLADVRPTAGSDPEAFIVIGDTLFFVANDADHGVELWKSDGTEAGTVLVKDIEPGPQSGAPHDFVALEGSLYFFVHDPSGRVQLWQSDGTEGGTTLVTGIFERFGFSKISDPVAFNGAIYFLGESSSNRTGGLLRSDGTAQGTQVIKEFTQPVTASLQDLVALGGALYLGGVDLAHGRELWTSDGTTDGTVLVKDINPGPDSSNPGTLSAEFVFFDGFLYFPPSAPAGKSCGNPMAPLPARRSSRTSIPAAAAIPAISRFSTARSTSAPTTGSSVSSSGARTGPAPAPCS